MANLTIAIDDEILRRARIRAIETGTSVNALLREYLESFAGDDRMQTRRSIVDHAREHTVAIGARGWSRDDLHDR